jgi:outer membrane protein assembly factor BamA
MVLAGAMLVVALASVCRAQGRTTLKSVEILGLQRLSADQVIAATGLRVGDLIDGPSIDAAADKLMRSGWFTSVNYRVRTADSDSTVIFEVAEKAAPAPSNTGRSDTLGQVTWSGNSTLTNQELTSAFGLRAGDPAARARVDQALEGVRKAYARRGYINAQIGEATTRDATGRVNYQFTIREGQQYRMGNVTVVGLSVADARELKTKWTLAPNAIFDDSYLEQFRTTVIRPFVSTRAQRTGVRSRFEVNTKPDTLKQTVDVIITFR